MQKLHCVKFVVLNLGSEIESMHSTYAIFKKPSIIASIATSTEWGCNTADLG